MRFATVVCGQMASWWSPTIDLFVKMRTKKPASAQTIRQPAMCLWPYPARSMTHVFAEQ